MYRKIEEEIRNYIKNKEEKILCIYGARQIGKTYIISKVFKEYFPNYIEINFDVDNKDRQLFKNVKSTTDFYLQLSALYGDKLNTKQDTVIFLDEIQVYKQYFSLLKQFKSDGKYTFVCSGSQLGETIFSEGLSPMGSTIEKRMCPMDFEEFLLANNVGKDVINYLKECFINKISVSENIHATIMNYFLDYLFVGGLPECVKIFVEEKNVMKIKEVQSLTFDYYKQDASKYDFEHKLNIQGLYDACLSNIDNKVKRIIFNNFNKKDTYRDHLLEFEYLINSGIALDCKGISEPKFPLVQSTSKSLIKLYLNDVGILSERLYKNNINAILNNNAAVNLGAIYETVVASELKAHNHDLYYYDRRKVGEVDFLINDYDNLCAIPIEIKSGKSTYTYRALPKLMEVEGYRINNGFVFSNNYKVVYENNIIQMPIYNIMFL